MRGGYRPGSGPKKGAKYRPRKKREVKVEPKLPAESGNLEADEYLRTVWNDPNIEPALRIRAAEIICKGDGEKKGKKDAKMDRAEKAGKGRFAASAPPQLKVVK